MRIVIDIDYDGPNEAGRHVVHTERAPWNQVVNVPGHAGAMDAIDYLTGIHKGTIPIAGTGWEEMTKHPQYPGKSRLDVFRAEIVRLNDAQARAALGL